MEPVTGVFVLSIPLAPYANMGHHDNKEQTVSKKSEMFTVEWLHRVMTFFSMY